MFKKVLRHRIGGLQRFRLGQDILLIACVSRTIVCLVLEDKYDRVRLELPLAKVKPHSCR